MTSLIQFSVAMGGITIDKVMTDPGLRQLASIIMDETRTAGEIGKSTARFIITKPGPAQPLSPAQPLIDFFFLLSFFHVAHADLERVLGADGYEPLKDEDLEYCMTLSDTMGPYKPSTMLDLVNRRKMEVKVGLEPYNWM